MWEKSTTDILLQTPFIGKILLSLPMVEAPGFGTFGVDGKVIVYDPEFAATLTPAERDGVRVHECMHILLGHHVRMGERNPERWNVACDYELNPFVLQAGYTLPKDALLDSQYADMSAEEIYEKLPNGGGVPGWSQFSKGKGDPEKLKDEWRKLTASVQWGDLPANLSRALKDNIQPKPGLAERLAPMLTSMMPTEDETWLPPSRRYALLPSYDVKPEGYVVACIDTSGSVDMGQLTEFASVLMGLAGVGRVDIIFGDCAVGPIVEEANSRDEILAAFSRAEGGGGTDFKPLLAEAAKRDPDAVVYLTDGCGDFGRPIEAATLWLLNSDVTAPWGSMLRINEI